MMTRREALRTGAGLGLCVGLATPRAWGRWGRAGVVASPGSGVWGAGATGAGESFFPWKEVGKGVHAVVDPETGGNTLLALGSDGALLIDTKFAAVGKALAREGGAMGVRLRHAVNTHHHADHTGGNWAFNAAGVGLVAHAKAGARVLANWDGYAGQVRGGVRFVGGLERPGQDRVIEEAGALSVALAQMDAGDWVPTNLMSGDRATLEFGGRTAELTHFGRGAHTDNDVVVFLPESNTLHTGDLVFNGLHPFFDPGGGATALGWVETLDAARALCDGKTVVVPGHGPIGDAGVIDAQRDYLRRLIDAVRQEIDAGATREEAAAKSWAFMEGLGFEHVRSRAIGAVYDEMKGED